MKKFLNTFAYLTAAAVLFCALPSHAKIVFKDPKKDDKGPGKYKYPTHKSYKKGDFDLRKVVIKKSGSNVIFKVTLRNRIKDVWKSKSWGGNGFSVQFVQIYIAKGKKKGFKRSLPGLNVKFAKKWQKVVLLSPQGKTRLKSEINLKAKRFKKGIVIPQTTRAQGKNIIAVVPVAALGGYSEKWGFQVIVQSNEGYPRKKDLLTRPVNEYPGKHRFGGGHDKDCDPHVIDILAGKAKGKSSEKRKQYKALVYKCGKGRKLAVLPFVYK